MDEVFFPRSENSNHGIGSCYKIKADGKVRFEEANDVCLDSSGKGSLRSSFSRRDQEYDLLLGALDFLHETNADNYDRTAADFVLAKERVWEGFEIPNAHYLYPMVCFFIFWSILFTFSFSCLFIFCRCMQMELQFTQEILVMKTVHMFGMNMVQIKMKIDYMNSMNKFLLQKDILVANVLLEHGEIGQMKL